MKICPGCRFANEERFPACLVCNTLIVNVRSTPPADPNHPEFARLTLLRARHRLARRQTAWAICVYASIVALTAAYPGCVFVPRTLVFYFAGGLVVACATSWDYLGQFTGGFLQGAISAVLAFHLGPLQIFVFYMLALHVLLPGFLWHWVDLIHSANR